MKAKRQKKQIEITLNLNVFKKYKGPIPAFRRAARKIAKQVKDHFTKKGHGWPVAYGQYVDDVFYEAMGHHLENYLLAELAKLKLPIELATEKRLGGEVMIRRQGKKK